MKGWALTMVLQVGQIVDASIRCICETSIDFFIKIKLTLWFINLVERIPQGQCLQQTQLLHIFFVSSFELWTVWILDLLFLDTAVIYHMLR